ncbi:MAG: hypothetical protein HY774_16255 [Acidobacteria bacterium]|nr:hypothetical protein [Acidobacteriota bacterium]
MLMAVFFLGCGAAAPVLAQYRFDQWTTDTGLPQNGVRSILQTRDEYVWFTTFDGLVRFDGVRFTVFDKGHTPGLHGNRFTTLYEDQAGTLWVGTEDGRVTLYRDGKFVSYGPAADFQIRAIQYFKTDQHGEVLIITQDGTFILHNNTLIPAQGDQDTPTQKRYVCPDGTRWLVEPSGITEIKAGQVTHYPINLDPLAINPDTKVVQDRQGRMWVGDVSSVYQLKDGQITRFTDQEGVPSGGQLSPQCEDSDGGIWFTTGFAQREGTGLVRFHNGRFQTFGPESGFPNCVLNTIYKDREGTLWVGTLVGLFRIRKQTIHPFSVQHGVVHPEVYPILQTRQGAILIGTVKGLTQVRDGQAAQLDVGLPAEMHNVQALWEDDLGRLWIGVVGGIFRYANGKLTNLSHLVGDLTVFAVHPDRQGRLWLATRVGAFVLADDQVVAHYTTRDGLPGNDVKVFHVDRTGTLWIGTYEGLARFTHGRFQSFTTAHGLSGNRIRSIYEDVDGVLWIGTYDEGLTRFQPGRAVIYRTEQGLFNNGVFHILEDQAGNFWISCNRGIYRVNRRELNELAEGKRTEVTSVFYGKDDGLLSTECNGGRQPAGLKASDGTFWFPTQNGVAVVDPRVNPLNPLPPSVHVESVTIDRKAAPFDQGIELWPGQANLEIAYTAPSFIKPEQIRFKYQLEGADTEMVPAGTRRVAYYPYVPPGSYRFRVIAANSDGVWNLEGATLNLVVHPPFYLTWQFRLACVLVVGGVGFWLYSLRIRQLKKETEVQLAFSRQLIASQEAERKRIAGELHDSLGQNLLLVRNLATLSLESLPDESLTRQQLTEISETTSLAIAEVRQIAHDLRPYQLERLGLTSALRAMLTHVKNSSDIEFEFEIDTIDGLLANEMEINLYRIVQECINNVLKHSEATSAQISVKRVGSTLEFHCRDNGKGFEVETIGRSTRHGMGLTSLTERVKMLAGSLSIHSTLNQGTVISVTLTVQP